MNYYSTDRQRGYLLAGFLAVLVGCASSPPSQFYTLSPLPPPESAPSATTNRAVILTVGPVTIPDYIDRPEIVTTIGPNQVAVNEFSRWAGSLESNVSRVIVEDLTALLPVGQFSVVRWSPVAHIINRASVYRVMVDVTRFDATLGDAAMFEADWVFYGSGGQVVFIRKSSRKVPIKGKEFKDMTAAMSQALAEFSGEVAAAVTAANSK